MLNPKYICNSHAARARAALGCRVHATKMEGVRPAGAARFLQRTAEICIQSWLNRPVPLANARAADVIRSAIYNTYTSSVHILRSSRRVAYGEGSNAHSGARYTLQRRGAGIALNNEAPHRPLDMSRPMFAMPPEWLPLSLSGNLIDVPRVQRARLFAFDFQKMLAGPIAGELLPPFTR